MPQKQPPSGREPEKQDISKRVGSSYMPSESHQKKVENFRLNITGELPLHEDPPPPLPAKMDKDQKKAAKKRDRKKGRKNRWLYRSIWMAMVVLIAVGVSQYVIVGASDMLAIQRGKEPATVVISLSKDATSDEIADILEENGLISQKDFFKLYSKITKADGNFGYGDFELTTDMDYEALINRLQLSNNRAETVEVMFPEGSTVQTIAQTFEDKGVCTKEQVMEIVNDYELFQGYQWIGKISNASERYYLLEGYLFPDTYEFYKNESPKVALGKMLNNAQNKITEDLQKQAQTRGMSIDEVITLASLIQAEAADTNDMFNISSVFHNRLEAGAASDVAHLDSDPTVWYPYANRAAVPESLVNTYKSRYNTYEVRGLPPGPICSPGEDAIKAALNPNDTDYLYFCHDKNGTPYYAKTSAEHAENMRKAGL